MGNCGFGEDLAKSIEINYHELYKESDEWVADKILQASKDGYVTCAFGLRLRTPLLRQVILNSQVTPYEAAEESRTAGNALGQSWGLLNTRSGSEFMGKVRKSKYRLTIRPIAQIHDSQYFMIKDDLDTLMYVNTNLTESMKWQKHPDIQHPSVGLGGELEVFYPSWNEGMGIPNQTSKEEITTIIKKHLSKLK